MGVGGIVGGIVGVSGRVGVDGCRWVGGVGVAWVQPRWRAVTPPEAAKKSQAALRRVSDRAQLREAADELGLDALAIEGRAERRHVRLHLGEQHAHLG